jgi:hypothetical protein
VLASEQAAAPAHVMVDAVGAYPTDGERCHGCGLPECRCLMVDEGPKGRNAA